MWASLLTSLFLGTRKTWSEPSEAGGERRWCGKRPSVLSRVDSELTRQMQGHEVGGLEPRACAEEEVGSFFLTPLSTQAQAWSRPGLCLSLVLTKQEQVGREGQANQWCE